MWNRVCIIICNYPGEPRVTAAKRPAGPVHLLFTIAHPKINCFNRNTTRLQYSLCSCMYSHGGRLCWHVYSEDQLRGVSRIFCRFFIFWPYVALWYCYQISPGPRNVWKQVLTSQRPDVARKCILWSARIHPWAVVVNNKLLQVYRYASSHVAVDYC